MGLLLSSIMRPQELVEFRKLNTTIDNVDIPASAESRTLTDKKGFILFGIGLLILIPFLIYALVNSDIRHFISGSDNCGNFCGYNNPKVSGVPCSGKDLSDKPYEEGPTCVKSCKYGHLITGECIFSADYKKLSRALNNFNKNNQFDRKFDKNRNFGKTSDTTNFDRKFDINRHFGKTFNTKDFDRNFALNRHFERTFATTDYDRNFGDPFGRQLNKRSTSFGSETVVDTLDFDANNVFTECRRSWWKFLLSLIITIAVGLLTLVLLRYVPAPFVWGIIIFSMLILVVITGGLWYGYSQMNTSRPNVREASKVFLIGAVVWTIIAAIILIVFIVLFKRIGLVVQLYKETTKVLAAMPMLVFVPVITTFVQIIVFTAAVITTVEMQFSRQLVHYDKNTYIYEMTGIIKFAIVFNIIVAIWTMRLISGIQYMTIAGSVARWYFAKNKDNLDSPICSSFAVTMRFHLGTIAFGSFLITLFAVVKAILKATIRNACCRCLVNMCCNSLEIILKFLSENSYIQTAIHGQSYLRSAKRATNLLLTNAASVIAINCVGDFVLGVIIFLLAILTTAISYALFMNMGPGAAIPTTICFFVNLLIIAIIFGTFQTVIDTLFICFCEDSVLNDGMSRPYYMSRGLMEFVENSKKVYGEKTGG